ncbi:MAG: hypothetical protein JNM93_04745 [Bacteriovoracaceae bacterium]|nr:hypothetical protein [Bacteriovoracaceae bacterium]
MKKQIFLVLCLLVSLAQAQAKEAYITFSESDKNYKMAANIVSAAASVYELTPIAQKSEACVLIKLAIDSLKAKSNEFIFLIDDMASAMFKSDELKEVDEAQSKTLMKRDILTKAEIEESGPYFILSEANFFERIAKLYQSGC